MADRYQQLVNTPIGRRVARQVGLPQSPRLERYLPGRPVIAGPVLVAAPGGHLAKALTRILASIEAEVMMPMDARLRRAAVQAKLEAGIWNPEAAAAGDQRFKALVFDASGLGSSAELVAAWEFFAPAIRRLAPSGRVIVLGIPPEDCSQPPVAIAQRALEGLVRAIGKEVGSGATAQLVHVEHRAEGELESTLRFLLSPRSAFVSGQVIRVRPAVAPAGELDWASPLAGRVALVTGAAGGIGSAIAEVLARDGARVVGLDVASMADELAAVTGRLGASHLTADITHAQAPAAIADHLLDAHGGVDVVVHNAGVTRDETLGRMSQEQWSAVLAVNLTAPQRIDQELFTRGAVRANGRIVAVSAVSGIAGHAAQSNYCTAKAGVIGFVHAWAPEVAKRGVTLNAVAPRVHRDADDGGRADRSP